MTKSPSNQTCIMCHGTKLSVQGSPQSKVCQCTMCIYVHCGDTMKDQQVTAQTSRHQIYWHQMIMHI